MRVSQAVEQDKVQPRETTSAVSLSSKNTTLLPVKPNNLLYIAVLYHNRYYIEAGVFQQEHVFCLFKSG